MNLLPTQLLLLSSSKEFDGESSDQQQDRQALSATETVSTLRESSTLLCISCVKEERDTTIRRSLLCVCMFWAVVPHWRGAYNTPKCPAGASPFPYRIDWASFIGRFNYSLLGHFLNSNDSLIDNFRSPFSKESKGASKGRHACFTMIIFMAIMHRIPLPCHNNLMSCEDWESRWRKAGENDQHVGNSRKVNMLMEHARCLFIHISGKRRSK